MSRPGSLWREPDFLRLWTGQTVSSVGSVITREALPLTAILVLNAQPTQLGILAAAGAVPALLIGLFAGVWVDRARRKPLMIAADLGRAVILVTIPAAAFARVLTMSWLTAAAFLAGGLTVIFSVAYATYLPTLVRPDQLVEGNSKLGTSDSLAEITGSALGGALVQAITAPMAILVDACSFILSALSLARIRTPESRPQRAGAPSWWGEARAGILTVRDDPRLRGLVGASATFFLFGGFFGALYNLYALRILAVTPSLLGLLVATGGVGALLGAATTHAAVRRWGYGRVLVSTCAVKGLAGFLVPLASGPGAEAVALLLASQLIGDFALSMYFVAAISLRQAVAPPDRLGRVNATSEFIEQGVAPFGLLAGGLLGQALGPRTTLALGAAGITLGTLWLAGLVRMKETATRGEIT